MGNISFEEVLDSSPAEDWPAIPRVDGDRIALDWAFKTALREALDCASTDDARIILNSAYLDVTDPQATYLIGTNGGHLYAANSFCVALSRSIIVPNEKFLSWPTFHDDGPWTLVASAAASAEEPCWIQVSSQRWTIVVRQPEGTYPNWKAVVPPPQRTCTQIELSDQALKQMQAFIPRLPGETEPNGPITLRIQNGCLVVGAQSGIMVPVPAAKVSGKPVLVSLNRTYLLKALRMGLDEIEISSADEVVVCQGKGKQLIIPPLRPDGPARIAEKTSPDPPLSPPQVTALLNEPEQENSCGEDNSQSEVVTVHAEPAEQPY